MAPKRFWLLKSEPSTYSIEHLERDGRTSWEGVRNYQARNFLREMKVGDRVLFYHSNAEPPGVAGVAQVVREAYPDPFAFDPASKYFDPGSKRDDPRWFMVDVGFVERFAQLVPLPVLRADPALEGMELLRRGSRLSVQPVTERQFERVVQLALGLWVGLPAPGPKAAAAKPKAAAAKPKAAAAKPKAAAAKPKAAAAKPKAAAARPKAAAARPKAAAAKPKAAAARPKAAAAKPKAAAAKPKAAAAKPKAAAAKPKAAAAKPKAASAKPKTAAAKPKAAAAKAPRSGRAKR